MSGSDDHARQVVRFAPTIAGMSRGAAELRHVLTPYRLSEATRYNVELVFDEVAANIVRHAGATDDVELQISFGADEIVMRFEDNGMRFDPSQRTDPTLPTSLDEAEVGGLGIFLVRQLAARLAYERGPAHRNICTLVITVS